MLRPEFVDNRQGNTLAANLRAYLRDQLETHTMAPAVWIATGYFKPEAFPMLAEELEQAREVRLLIGAEPATRPPRPRRVGESPETYDAHLVQESLQALQEGLERDRNLLGFLPETDRTLERLIAFLRSDRVEVRLYRRRFLHGKAFLLLDDGVVVGSSNFTPGGLAGNLELNLGQYQPGPVGQVQDWYADLWEQADPYDLAALYEARFQPYDPYLVYLRVLWELYGPEEAEAEKTGIVLADFQRDGLLRAKRILEEHNGVLIADGVGLGKTYIAGELIRQAVFEKRQRVLLIAPAALRDGTWARFLELHNIPCKCLSYEQLAADVALGGDGGDYLKCDPQEYAPVIIDEAQALRNPAAKRAQALRRLLAGDPPKPVVMLTATPVNNSLWDLYYMLNYFLPHDSAFADRGILSVKKRFEQAAAEDPFELKPDVLFDVLDEVCVRRTRHFVRRWYPNAFLLDPAGNRVPVTFPKPRLRRADYDSTVALPGFFDELEAALMPEEGLPQLIMARYQTTRYRKDDQRLQIACVADPEELAAPFERQLVGLLRSALLKRFESSTYAFVRTVDRMVETHDRFLQALDRGYIAEAEVLDQLEDADNDEALENLLIESPKAEAADQFEAAALRRDVVKDRELLIHLADRARTVERKDDPKLAELKDKLAEIVRMATHEGLDEADQRNQRKVLLFSYYADTVDWIEQYLAQVTDPDSDLYDRRLDCYRGRIVSVTSDDSRGGVSREKAIFGFAPVSTEAPPARREDRFDIMVCTDVLAEGMNLQQSRHVINYDLPWNPMRIVQRNGRVDRIGSHYKDVHAWCFFPEDRLEAMLDLEQRIRRKIAQAAASIGVENPPVPGAQTGEHVFTDSREEIEALLRGDTSLLNSGGEAPSAYSGEEYRQELRQGMQSRGSQVRALPWAAGSGYVAEGKERGWVFCARVGDQVFLRFVPAGEGEVASGKLRCLSLFTCAEDTPRLLAEDLRSGVYAAWERACEHLFVEWTETTDPARLQPEVPRLFRAMAEHVRRYPPPGKDAGQVDDLVDRLQAPWPRRVERPFREFFDPDRPPSDPVETSRRIDQTVREQGLQPFRPPPPRPPIDRDQIVLVCWMGVDSFADGQAKSGAATGECS